ncbi:MAG: SUMF1/EgtB/PvdO family nonheme iron enzyme, partial [Candidatus Hydrogenedentes bacterium]|nr:SUMF1/EgtB/PvdO family nonheme iron enzyme [Candidatus Hydrogenedentota bacterium]
VVGMSQSDADDNLVLAGLTVGNTTQQTSDTIEAGDVISQSHPAGGSVDEGSAVDLVISTGPGNTADEETIMLPGNMPLEMVWIEPGTFLMGRYPGEQDSYDWEDPQHEVTLTQGFWMGKYELTKAQWTAVMETEPWSGRSCVLDDPDSPAVYVSWNEAQAFIMALNDYTGLTFRLPTEAEWEYACRAGTTTRFYWGDDPDYTLIDDYAWWEGNASNIGEEYAHVVGQKLPNAFGLYDMSGNVWEWCQDWWDSDYCSSSPGTDPEGPASGSHRVLRGGNGFIQGIYCPVSEPRLRQPLGRELPPRVPPLQVITQG